MSKINAIRIINLTYNHNPIHIADETFFLNGENALIQLENGGGKSVLIQMLIAPFVHKRYRNTNVRPFTSYFTTKIPTLILVEWVLDHHAGYVLTGMVVQRNMRMDEKNSEDLDILTIINEYKMPRINDLVHLPVVEKSSTGSRVLSFSECRQLFEGYKKSDAGAFNFYDMNSSTQSRQYFDRLAQYGILASEWQTILKRINDEESGLSKLFANCQDEKDLITQWFLPAIENKLDQQESRITGFQNLFEKYISKRHSMMGTLRFRDSVLQFNEAAAPMRESALRYQELDARVKTTLDRVAAYRLELGTCLEETHALEAECRSDLERQLADLRQIDWQQRSTEYYSEQDRLTGILAECASLTASLDALQAEHDRLLDKRHSLDCARQQALVDENQAALLKIDQAIEVCRKEEVELAPEREYLGYCLRRILEDEIKERTQALQKNSMAIEDLQRRREEATALSENLSGTIGQLSRELGRLEADIRNYDQAELRYNHQWKASLSRNMFDIYEPTLEEQLHTLTGQVSALQKSLESSRTRLKESRRELDQLTRVIRDTEQKSRKAESELEQKKAEKATAEAEISRRREILKMVDLGESALFDPAAILAACQAKAAEIDARIREMTTEIARMEDHMYRIATGRTPALDDAQTKLFESLDIPIVYGMEWLRKNGKSEQENLDLVTALPFLPYALILTRAEWLRLSAGDARVFTSAPIPIILREELQTSTSVPDSDGLHFYMMFNQELLSVSRLGEMLEEIDGQKTKKTADLAQRKSEQQMLLVAISQVEAHRVTREALLQIEERISDLEQTIRQLEETRLNQAEHQKALMDEREALMSAIPEIESQISTIGQQMRDLEDLKGAYETCLKQQRRLETCKAELSQAEEQKHALAAELEKMMDRLELLRSEHRDLEAILTEKQNEAAGYARYEKAERPPQLAEDILADPASIRARYLAITESVSRQWQALEEQHEEASRRLTRSKQELSHLAERYHLSPESWAEIRYTTSAEDIAEHDLAVSLQNMENMRKKIGEAEKQQARTETRIEHIMEMLRKECQKDAPLPREELPQIDFEAHRTRGMLEVKSTRELLDELKSQVQMYNSNLDSLSRYQDIVPASPVTFDRPIRSLTHPELRTFTGHLLTEHETALQERNEEQRRLTQILSRILRQEAFQESYFKVPLEPLQNMLDQAERFRRQLDIITRSFNDQVAKLQADIDVVETEKARISDMLTQYVSEMHHLMGQIDWNSGISLRGKTMKMLKIDCPSWENNLPVYDVHMQSFMDTLTSRGIDLLTNGGSLHDYLGKALTAENLYNAIVGIENIHIHLLKVEAESAISISWKESLRSSGGEGFLSAFVVLSCLLAFMRYDESDPFNDRNEGKLILMDNPFAKTTAEHLLTPMADLAAKTNTQLICFTAVHGEAILNRFNNIYVLNLVPSSYGRGRYLKGEHLAGNEPNTLALARIDVHPEGEQLSMFT